MDVRKEIARPGTYTYINPRTGLPERLTVTPETVRYWRDQGEAMLRDGLSIPVPLEHQADARPQTAAERDAKRLLNNAGFVKKFEVSQVEGQERLFSVLDIPDSDIAKKLPTTIRSVSPWISTITDGNGKVWQGVIGHVALTTQPRMHKQANFETLGAALSLAGAGEPRKTDTLSAEGASISRLGLLGETDGKIAPLYPIGFSMLTGVALGGIDIPDDDDEDDDDDDDDGADANKKKEKGSFDGGGVDDDESSAGDVSFEELIVHLLEMMLGEKLGVAGRGKGFLKGLAQDLMYRAKKNSGKEKQDPNEQVLGAPPGQTPPTKRTPVQESPPMYMSMTSEQVAAITDPKERATAEAFLSLRQGNDALRRNALDQAAQRRSARVNLLLSRLPKDQREALDKLLKDEAGAALSLGSDGVVVDPLDRTLTVLEAGIPDLPKLLTTVSAGLSVVEQPQPVDAKPGTITKERAEELANWAIPAPAKA